MRDELSVCRCTCDGGKCSVWRAVSESCKAMLTYCGSNYTVTVVVLCVVRSEALPAGLQKGDQPSGIVGWWEHAHLVGFIHN